MMTKPARFRILHFNINSHGMTHTPIPKVVLHALLLLLMVVLLGFSTSAQFTSSAQDTDVDAHKTVIRSLYEQGITGGDFEVLGDILAPTYVNHGLRADLDVEGFEAYLTSLRTALPDLEAVIEVLIAQGEWGASRVLLRGTFENEWVLGDEVIAPNNELVAWSMITLHHFDENGQIVEDFTSYDDLGLRIQLGVNPLPAELAAFLPEREYVPAVMEEEPSVGMEAIQLETFRGVIEDAINNGDLDAIDTNLPEDYIAHEPFGDYTRAQFRLIIEGFRTVVPDLAVSTEVVITEGNWLATYLIYAGTFSVDISTDIITVPATNEPIRFAVNVMVHFDNEGVALEDFKEYNSLGWLRQLGVLPPAE